MTENTIPVKTSQKKVLIVDDEENIREFIEIILHDEGYETHQATNGAEALQAIDHFDPDLVILDYMMPELSGLDVLRTIANLQNKIPCIIITGKGSEEIAVTMLKEGAFDYLTKPFYKNDFLETVTKAIEFGDIPSLNMHHEYLWLKKENIFLKEQLNFMRKVLQIDRDGDAALEELRQDLIELDIAELRRDTQLLNQKLQELRKGTGFSKSGKTKH